MKFCTFFCNIFTDNGLSGQLDSEDEISPPYKKLSILDRFLVVWILLAMGLGILLGNVVPSSGPALQKGQFVGVSVPIGKRSPVHQYSGNNLLIL